MGNNEKCKNPYIEPKDKHGVDIAMNVNSEDAAIIRECLAKTGHIKASINFETLRELGIMREVKKAKGNSIYEKIDNTLEYWSKCNYCGESTNKTPKYKMKHRTLAK